MTIRHRISPLSAKLAIVSVRSRLIARPAAAISCSLEVGDVSAISKRIRYPAKDDDPAPRQLVTRNLNFRIAPRRGDAKLTECLLSMS